MRRDKKRWTKGRMARELVYYCLWMLTAVATWAMILKTAAVLMDRTCDLSDVLVFAGAAFGGELLLLLLKRVFAKPSDTNDENGGTAHMDYTNIITAVITLLTALVSAFLIPWMKERIGAEKLAKWQQYVDIAVRAAEQLYNATDGAEKKAYVLRYLASKGIQFDSDTVDKMIESAVLTLHHELYGGASDAGN